MTHVVDGVGGCGLILGYVVDEVVEGTVQVPTVQPEPNKANPKLGIGSMAFSADSRYLYSKNGQSLQRFLYLSLSGSNTVKCMQNWSIFAHYIYKIIRRYQIN